MTQISVDCTCLSCEAESTYMVQFPPTPCCRELIEVHRVLIGDTTFTSDEQTEYALSNAKIDDLIEEVKSRYVGLWGDALLNRMLKALEAQRHQIRKMSGG